MKRQTLLPSTLEFVPRPGDREIRVRPFSGGERVRNERQMNARGE